MSEVTQHCQTAFREAVFSNLESGSNHCVLNLDFLVDEQFPRNFMTS